MDFWAAKCLDEIAEAEAEGLVRMGQLWAQLRLFAEPCLPAPLLASAAISHPILHAAPPS